MADVSAVVLCGGLSSRMGRPKAWLPWRGHPMITHVVGVLGQVTDDIVVVTSESLDLPPLPARVVRDDLPGHGPLAGLAVGLADARQGLSFVTSTDAPFLTPGFATAVLAPGVAAAPVADGHVQTLAAAYPSERGAAQARRLLEAGKRRPLDLLETLDYQQLPIESLPDGRSLDGFNTPSEYLAAVCAEGAASATVEFIGRARRLIGREAIDVPVGSLRDVLGHAPASAGLVEDGRLAASFLVSLGGRDFVRDLDVPIGPGEAVVVLDAAAGG
ncbi:MAG: molybdenum cofactor guanylyltransferase [Myxococcales bacterium]|nr:molybdenum cofactor guanylyltransferase [Myxococcales bacterium]